MEGKCACKGDYLDKFIQPAILALVLEKPAHGFYLMAELEKRHLVADADATGFYRTLRKLEEDGKLSAAWDVGDGAKPKKVYRITDTGLACLKNWQRTLRNYIARITLISGATDCALANVEKEKEKNNEDCGCV